MPANRREGFDEDDHLFHEFLWDTFHLTSEDVADFVAGHSSPEKSREIVQHIKQCQACWTEIVTLRSAEPSGEEFEEGILRILEKATLHLRPRDTP